MTWENAFLVCEMYIYTLGEIERQSLNYVMLGEKKLAGDTQNVKGVFLQSGIIGIFIFPPFLILNQTLSSIYLVLHIFK